MSYGFNDSAGRAAHGICSFAYRGRGTIIALSALRSIEIGTEGRLHNIEGIVHFEDDSAIFIGRSG